MVAPVDPFVGRVIDGRYEIQARIGEGGMGVVYRAKQISIDRVIAIKMLNAQMAQDPTWVQRFYNEAKACSRLQHPNTIRMFDFGQTQDSRLFMTMEFLDGISLRDAITKGPLAPNRVVKILIQCCASLAEAHSIGIIHRDIKPDNVFLLNMAGSPDFVKLLDFSVAKLLEGDRMKTQAGVVFGTPQYMSPEQGRGLPLDPRSDLYALGILAYEMLVGTVPFNDENPMTVIQMHLAGNIPAMPASIPYNVQQVVRRAMEKDAARRYQSAGEMMQHAQQVFSELNSGNVAMGGGGVPRTVVAQMPQPGMGHPGMQPGMGMQPQQGMGMPQQGMGMGMPGQQMMQPGMHPGMQGQPNMGQPPQQQQGGAPPGGYQPSTAAAKTMIAGISPFGPGGLPMPGQPGGGMPGMQPPQQAQPPQSGLAPQGGFQGAPAAQKTMIAGMGAPQMVNGQYVPPGQQGGMPGQMPGGMPGQGGYPQQQQGGYGQQPGGPAPGGGPQKTVMLQPSEGVVSVARTTGQALPVAGGGLANTGGGATIQQGASTLFWIVSLVVGIAIGVLAYVIVLQVM